MKRINKVPEKWTEGELQLWAQDKVQATRGISGGAIAKEAAKRFGLEEGLNVAAIKERVKDMDIPAAESEPQEAPESAPEETQEQNVGEDVPVEEERPEEPPEATAEPAAIPEVVTREVPEPQPAAPVEKPQEQGNKSVSRSIFDDQLQRYLKGMRPGSPIGARDGAKLQQVLYRTIQLTLNQEGSDFAGFYGDLLKTVKEHRDGAFHERYAFRFMDHVQLTPVERRNFERLLHLMITTCDPTTRKQALKQVDMTAAISGLSQDVQQKLQEYYGGI